MNGDEIMKEYEARLASGLRSRSVRIDDIERYMGEAIEEFKAGLNSRTREIIEQSGLGEDIKCCPDCSRDLKKTR